MADERPSIKDEATYEALREDGASKEKAARIANARANEDQQPSKKGGQQPAYEDWSVDALRDRAAEIGIKGRSEMKKAELIEALRNH
ncbi:MAG: Rho termination factor N-terminal domain-containing protein [Pseudomonadota bacterium]